MPKTSSFTEVSGHSLKEGEWYEDQQRSPIPFPTTAHTSRFFISPSLTKSQAPYGAGAAGLCFSPQSVTDLPRRAVKFPNVLHSDPDVLCHAGYSEPRKTLHLTQGQSVLHRNSWKETWYHSCAIKIEAVVHSLTTEKKFCLHLYVCLFSFGKAGLPAFQINLPSSGA